MHRTRTLALLLLATALVGALGCAGVRTFPSAARAGDTVVLPVGSFDEMDLTNTIFTLDAEGDPGDPADDVVGLDLAPHIRGIFNVYPDPVSAAANYDTTLTSGVHQLWFRPAWQTLVLLDLDPALPAGSATLHVSTVGLDPSSGYTDLALGLEILPGTGAPDALTYLNSFGGLYPLDPTRLTPKPHADIQFLPSGTVGGAEVVLALDDPAVNLTTVNVIPRHLHSGGGSFETSQAACYWHMASDHLTVRLLAPQGTDVWRLAFSVVYQSTTGTPAFSLDTAATHVWDVNGVEVAASPTLTAHP